MKLPGFPTYRCGECTLMRCYESGQTCDECRQHVREAFDRVMAAAFIQLPDGKTLYLGRGYNAVSPFSRP